MSAGHVAAVVLAAGRSTRMGQPKMALPWAGTTVIGQVAAVLQAAAVAPIVVVTGGGRELVAEALAGQAVQLAYNPRFDEDQMAYSLAAGLAALPADVEAALVALGDQPQIEPAVVRQVLDAYHAGQAGLVFPSYQQRRGHPWIIARALWPAIFAVQPPATLRDVMRAHAAQIEYVTVASASILSDLDTPEDYQRSRPSD